METEVRGTRILVRNSYQTAQGFKVLEVSFEADADSKDINAALKRAIAVQTELDKKFWENEKAMRDLKFSPQEDMVGDAMPPVQAPASPPPAPQRQPQAQQSYGGRVATLPWDHEGKFGNPSYEKGTAVTEINNPTLIFMAKGRTDGAWRKACREEVEARGLEVAYDN